LFDDWQDRHAIAQAILWQAEVTSDRQQDRADVRVLRRAQDAKRQSSIVTGTES
jgi:hypothetical protein